MIEEERKELLGTVYHVIKIGELNAGIPFMGRSQFDYLFNTTVTAVVELTCRFTDKP